MSFNSENQSSEDYQDYLELTTAYSHFCDKYLLKYNNIQNNIQNDNESYFIEINKGSYPEYSQDHEKPKKINFLNLSSSFNLNKLIMRIIINIDPKYKNDSQYYIDDQGFKTYILQYSKQISDNTIILFCQFLLVSNTQRNYIMYYNFTGQYLYDNHILQLRQHYSDNFTLYQPRCLADVDNFIYHQYPYYDTYKNKFSLDIQKNLNAILIKHSEDKKIIKGLIQILTNNINFYYFQPTMEIMKWIAHTDYYDITYDLLKLRTKSTIYTNPIREILNNSNNIEIDMFIETIKFNIQDNYDKILGFVFLYLSNYELEGAKLDLLEPQKLVTRLDYYKWYQTNSDRLLNSIQ
tara:strand:+ start:207 stop:1256 length:1050 start_codon:yes stop_codon:yes gene_type:complete